MVRIAQEQTYRGGDWWDWSVWLEGAPAELDDINEVEWRLHPSFAPSKVTRRNRNERFRLSTNGWGTFTISAELRLKTGRAEILTHELELSYPDDDETKAPTKSDRPEVGGYVHELDLPTAPAPSRGIVETEGFDERLPLIAVGRQIVEFADGVSGKVRRTVCHGLLLAQLATDTKAPGGASFWEWYNNYSDVLNKIGWSSTRRDSATQPLQHADAPFYEAALPILRSVLGPSIAAGSRLLRVLQQLGQMDDRPPWLTFLDRNSLGSRGGPVGLLWVGSRADGGADVISLFVQVAAPQQGAPLFFLQLSDGQVQTVSAESTINGEMLAVTEALLAAKVKPFVDQNVRGVEDGSG